jgi:prepilin-type N-terminal cleavage/methylation domain-containing protein
MRKNATQSGFTLIEMIVSLALFSVVITISVGALLVLIASNKQLQDDQNILTNLSFALDSMTREIRTGTAYYCASRSNTSGNNHIFAAGYSGPSNTAVQDCDTGRPTNTSGDVHGISFVEGGESITGAVTGDRIVYFHDRSTSAIYRRVGNGVAQPITSSSLVVTEVDFFVNGVGSVSAGERDQPTVTIFLEAAAGSDPGDKRYQIQTTVVQRTLDL